MTGIQPLPVLLVDDEPHFRQAIGMFLAFYNAREISSKESYPLQVIGEADAADLAILLAQKLQPQLILLDLELAESDGISVLLRLREINFQGKVLVLSAHQEDEWIFQAMQAGATGYVFKHHLCDQLADAIDTIFKSEIYLPPEVASGFFRLFQIHEQSRWQSRRSLCLTEREYEVLNWLAQGASNEEIAKYLYVTVSTVKAHLTNIFEKLQVTSRTQAIVTAFKLGLVKT